ncbi:hypothetical protein ABZV75_10485 [Streptomyces flaveolus]|uniref:MmyB family transcriptional regulator n=1 Tax=Streptomyces flaveolus TaxID=67297 RepID=UPI0033A1B1E0
MAGAPPATPGTRPGHARDPRLAALVGELSLVSPRFRHWWADLKVARPDFGTKTIRHPELGDLTLDWDAFGYLGDPDQQFVLWSDPKGAGSHDRLPILASWSAPATERNEARTDDREPRA